MKRVQNTLTSVFERIGLAVEQDSFVDISSNCMD